MTKKLREYIAGQIILLPLDSHRCRYIIFKLLNLLKMKRNTEGSQRKKSHNIYQNKDKTAKDFMRDHPR